MAQKRILIVGGVAGGATCAARLRRLCEDCEIIIFEMGSYVSFANCGLPYFIGDVIVDEDKLLMATPELFKNRFNIQVCTETEVISINRADKTLVVRDLTTCLDRVECYDALVLSTGASAVWPDIDGIKLPGIYALRTIPDSREIRAVLESMTRAVVMGAGYLGLELAENLSKRGVKGSIFFWTRCVTTCRNYHRNAKSGWSAEWGKGLIMRPGFCNRTVSGLETFLVACKLLILMRVCRNTLVRHFLKVNNAFSTYASTQVGLYLLKNTAKPG